MRSITVLRILTSRITREHCMLEKVVFTPYLSQIPSKNENKRGKDINNKPWKMQSFLASMFLFIQVVCSFLHGNDVLCHSLVHLWPLHGRTCGLVHRCSTFGFHFPPGNCHQCSSEKVPQSTSGNIKKLELPAVVDEIVRST